MNTFRKFRRLMKYVQIVKFQRECFTISSMNENNSDICFKQVIAPTHRRSDLKEQVKSCTTEYVSLKTPLLLLMLPIKFIQLIKIKFQNLLSAGF